MDNLSELERFAACFDENGEPSEEGLYSYAFGDREGGSLGVGALRAWQMAYGPLGTASTRDDPHSFWIHGWDAAYLKLPREHDSETRMRAFAKLLADTIRKRRET